MKHTIELTEQEQSIIENALNAYWNEAFLTTQIKMSNKKAVLLAGMLADTMAEQERKDYFEFTNPYAGLDGLTYSGSGQKSYSKSPMTNKQKSQGLRLNVQNKLVNVVGRLAANGLG